MRLQIAQVRPHTSNYERHGAGGLAVLEIFVAALVVVGLFDAACQPFGWSAAVQSLLCGSLGLVLWIADRRMQGLATADEKVNAVRGEAL